MHTQVEKLCKLREVYCAMGYDKDFEMYLADSKFELPRMKKGGYKNQTPTMGVAALRRQNSFSPNSQVSSGPNGENTVGKRILDANGHQNAQNCMNSGEEQLIAFGEATVENVGMGSDKNSRTVTFELSKAQSGTNLLAATSLHLFQVIVKIRHFLKNCSTVGAKQLIRHCLYKVDTLYLDNCEKE